MKFITAIIKPSKLDDVRQELTGLDITGMTVTEARGFGRQKGQTEVYRGAEYEISFVPKIMIQVGVTEDLADRAVDAIQRAAATGKIGDGKIFVVDLSKVVRIRTGETDNDAL